MGKSDHCCVGGCSNTRSQSNLIVKRSHVTEMQWFGVNQSEEKRKVWESQIGKGRLNFKMGPSMKVCSNHFVDGRPTTANPNPVLFLTPSDESKKSPKKRNAPTRIETPSSSKSKKQKMSREEEGESSCSSTQPIPLSFTQVTRESDVRCFTGFKSTEMFKYIFSSVEKKASYMLYWKGSKQTNAEKLQ